LNIKAFSSLSPPLVVFNGVIFQLVRKTTQSFGVGYSLDMGRWSQLCYIP